MPRTETGPAAGVQCLACSTMDARRVHDCPAAKGQRGIIPVKAWPGGKPPSKAKYLKAVKDAQKKQATARQKATAKPFEKGTKVKLPSRVKPSTEAEIDEFFYPELRSGPVLTYADRLVLAKTVFCAYFTGGFRDAGGLKEMVAALKAAKVVVEPWKCDWFQGFVSSDADLKKQKAAGTAKGRATQKEASEERFDADDFDDRSDSHKAAYHRLARKLANEVADRDNKQRPKDEEIWEDAHYSVRESNFGRPTPSTRLVDFHTVTIGSTSRTASATRAPAASGSSAVGRAVGAGMSWSSTGSAARTRARCPTRTAARSATRRAARTRTTPRRRSTSTPRRTRWATPARSRRPASRSWAAGRTATQRRASRGCARRP